MARGVLLVLLFVLGCFLFATVSAGAVYSAHAKLSASNQGSLLFRSGWVRFDQISATDARVNVTVRVEGSFPSGQYHLIVHEYGDITDNSAASLGPHFVGGGANVHGCPPNPARHEGDLGTWEAVDGVISASQVFDLDAATVSLHAPHEIIGLGVAIHTGPDTCNDEPDPNNLDVLAMGVIGVVNVDNNEAHYDSDTTHNAVAYLLPTTGCPACSGTFWFQDTDKGVLVEAQVFGLTQGTAHGVNIYTFGDLSGANGEKLGAHLNPYGRSHGLPPTMPRHMGDLGNIQDFSVSASSSWYYYEATNVPNVKTIIGRAIAVGAEPDHGTGIGCDQTGNSGAPLALGVIGVANPSTTLPSLPSDVTPTTKWTSLNCTVPNNVSPHDGDGRTAALWIGWGLAVFFLGFSVTLIVYYYAKLRGRAGYEEF